MVTQWWWISCTWWIMFKDFIKDKKKWFLFRILLHSNFFFIRKQMMSMYFLMQKLFLFLKVVYPTRAITQCPERNWNPSLINLPVEKLTQNSKKPTKRRLAWGLHCPVHIRAKRRRKLMVNRLLYTLCNKFDIEI